jgi:hypothetical protein
MKRFLAGLSLVLTTGTAYAANLNLAECAACICALCPCC